MGIPVALKETEGALALNDSQDDCKWSLKRRTAWQMCLRRTSSLFFSSLPNVYSPSHFIRQRGFYMRALWEGVCLQVLPRQALEIHSLRRPGRPKVSLPSLQSVRKLVFLPLRHWGTSMSPSRVPSEKYVWKISVRLVRESHGSMSIYEIFQVANTKYARNMFSSTNLIKNRIANCDLS